MSALVLWWDHLLSLRLGGTVGGVHPLGGRLETFEGLQQVIGESGPIRAGRVASGTHLEEALHVHCRTLVQSIACLHGTNEGLVQFGVDLTDQVGLVAVISQFGMEIVQRLDAALAVVFVLGLRGVIKSGHGVREDAH